MSNRERDWDKSIFSQFCCSCGKLSFLLFRFLSFVRNGLFLWLVSITVSLTILGAKFLGVSICFTHQRFHADIFFLSDSSNMSAATNRDNILVIPWHSNHCNPGLHAAAVMILSCKQMTLFLEDTRWCLKLFLFIAWKWILRNNKMSCNVQ